MNKQIRQLLTKAQAGRRVEVEGWVRTRRNSGRLCFLEISDGSCLANLQVIAEDKLENFESVIKKLGTGSAVRIKGDLVLSPAKGQEVELRAIEVEVLGASDSSSYPLQKKRHSFEFLRTIPHLRPRTNALGAVARIRSTLSFAIHRFFRKQGFFYVHTPIITTSDCEGAGEMFTITTYAQENQPTGDSSRQEFFGKQAGLTVSGQLQAEIYALALGRVYTFGPTFRAENSNTSRHLAEFWMIEPEMAFCDLACDMDMAENMVKELLQTVLDECSDELHLFDRFVCKGLLHRLRQASEHPFARMTYTEAITELEQAERQFEVAVRWGMDLQAEHERFLCEQVAGRPLIITNYPKEIKPFYMRLDDSGDTVAAMDILVPGIGELIGGSQREERYPILLQRMQEVGLDVDQYQWYLDLRRYGSAPHAGFGLGFERLIQFVTGMGNIRDVIPFPRTPGSAPC